MRGVGKKTPRNRVFLANKENYAVEMTVGPVGFTVFTKFSIFHGQPPPGACSCKSSSFLPAKGYFQIEFS